MVRRLKFFDIKHQENRKRAIHIQRYIVRIAYNYVSLPPLTKKYRLETQKSYAQLSNG
jgi:hypothetical protein